MAKTPKKIDGTDERSPAETERVADATLKRLLSTPPNPHKEMVGKSKAKVGQKVKSRPGRSAGD